MSSTLSSTAVGVNNTITAGGSLKDGFQIRRTAAERRIPFASLTQLSGSPAILNGNQNYISKQCRSTEQG
jgi:hypothetical protein